APGVVVQIAAAGECDGRDHGSEEREASGGSEYSKHHQISRSISWPKRAKKAANTAKRPVKRRTPSIRRKAPVALSISGSQRRTRRLPERNQCSPTAEAKKGIPSPRE